jgi:hypothetical protein
MADDLVFGACARERRCARDARVRANDGARAWISRMMGSRARTRRASVGSRESRARWMRGNIMRRSGALRGRVRAVRRARAGD